MFGIKFYKSNQITHNRTAKKIFSKCKIKKFEDKYYYLSPMPSSDQLAQYYKIIYSNSKTDKEYGSKEGVINRDLIHFNLLKYFIPMQIKQNKVFLNFGAGHGGVSHLFWSEGMDIINVEPGGIPNFYENRWKTYESIEEIAENSIDLVYGSHSLEHVQNIDYFKNQISRIIKPNGHLFWEVPNADSSTNGAKIGKVIIPHTYYFTTKFFDSWFSNVILNKAYDQSQRLNIIEKWNDYVNKEGSVIRVLGQID